MRADDHVITIDVQYFAVNGPDSGGVHKWRVICTCGFASEWSLSPRATHRALEMHRAQYPRIGR